MIWILSGVGDVLTLLSGVAGVAIRTTPCMQTKRSLSNGILSLQIPFWYIYNIFFDLT
jgi:hypothetical protein